MVPPFAKPPSGLVAPVPSGAGLVLGPGSRSGQPVDPVEAPGRCTGLRSAPPLVLASLVEPEDKPSPSTAAPAPSQPGAIRSARRRRPAHRRPVHGSVLNPSGPVGRVQAAWRALSSAGRGGLSGRGGGGSTAASGRDRLGSG